MSTLATSATFFTPDPPVFPPLPDHTQLPDEDGEFVHNLLEHPQSILLTDSVTPVLESLHPDGHYAIGQDSGIYWKFTDPPLLGCKAPDWFYVPNVPPLLDGVPRRSLVLWKEGQAPTIVIEFVCGDGSEERDKTPQKGKFWVYEQGIRVPYYAIWEVALDHLELYSLENGRYRRREPNERGHFEVTPMNVELGIWHGNYRNQELPWLRWWDAKGNMLPTSDEQLLAADARVLAADERTLVAERQVQKLAEKLRALGVDPDQV